MSRMSRLQMRLPLPALQMRFYRLWWLWWLWWLRWWWLLQLLVMLPLVVDVARKRHLFFDDVCPSRQQEMRPLLAHEVRPCLVCGDGSLNRFAVDQKRAGGQCRNGGDNERKAREIIAVPRDEPDTPAITARHDAKA